MNATDYSNVRTYFTILFWGTLLVGAVVYMYRKGPNPETALEWEGYELVERTMIRGEFQGCREGSRITLASGRAVECADTKLLDMAERDPAVKLYQNDGAWRMVAGDMKFAIRIVN